MGGDFWSPEGQLRVQICIRKGFGHEILTLWRPLGHQEATKRAPRSPRGGPRALKEPLATPQKLPRSFLGARMELKKVQKSPTRAWRSSKDDLKINKRKCSQNQRKLDENHWFFEIRGPGGSSDLHRKGFRDPMLRLWRCQFEALELPEAPRGDQESPKKLSKRPLIMIYRPCQCF